MRTARQPAGTAFALRDPLPWDAFAGLATYAERLGYAAVFLPEIAGRDAFASLTGLAAETTGLLLGTGIVPMTSRSVLLTAMGAATVHERSGGRAILGVGTGRAVPGALARLRDEVIALRELLEGREVEHEGERLSLSLDPGGRVPIWISALGPKAVRLAGEAADGVLLNWCTPERVATARVRVRDSATDAGRDPNAVTIAVYVRASVGDDADAALRDVAAAAREYASYPAYARQFAAMGLGAEAERAAAGDADDLARAVCLVGDPSIASQRLAAYRDAGADLVVVYPVASDTPEREATIRMTLDRLAPPG